MVHLNLRLPFRMRAFASVGPSEPERPPLPARRSAPIAALTGGRFQVFLAGAWQDLTVDEDALLQRFWVAGCSQAGPYKARGVLYECDFLQLEQRNLSSGRVRQIRPPQQACGGHSQRSGSMPPLRRHQTYIEEEEGDKKPLRLHSPSPQSRCYSPMRFGAVSAYAEGGPRAFAKNPDKPPAILWSEPVDAAKFISHLF